MNSPLQVLHLEDNAADTELIQATLEAEGVHVSLTRVEAEDEFVSALKQERFDLILADYTLPSFDGLSALRIAQQHARDVPLIFVSGTLGEDIAIEALKTGATDYVLKTRLVRLGPSVKRALHEAQEKAGRKRAELALRRSERELRQVIETIPAMVWSALPDGSNVLMNSRWTEYTGLSAAGLGWQAAVHPKDLSGHMDAFRTSSAAGLPFEAEVRFRRSDGEYRWFLVQGTPLRDEQGNILKWYGIVTDIEDRKRAEEVRLEERDRERTRIARELHDTLLQSFQGLLLKFQAASNQLPARPLEAKQRLDSTINQAAEAITEGRDAVLGLRSSAFETNDLANGIKAIGEELITSASGPDLPAINVEVEGSPRKLNPGVRDEAYRIAGEALRNAFRHAQARQITVEIRYDKRQFGLRVRDDGKGLDEETLRRQPVGHFGLHGMRERAEIVGGRLEVSSKLGAGTEVELSIPGAIAYGASIRRSVVASSFGEWPG